MDTRQSYYENPRFSRGLHLWRPPVRGNHDLGGNSLKLHFEFPAVVSYRPAYILSRQTDLIRLTPLDESLIRLFFAFPGRRSSSCRKLVVLGSERFVKVELFARELCRSITHRLRLGGSRMESSPNNFVPFNRKRQDEGWEASR